MTWLSTSMRSTTLWITGAEAKVDSMIAAGSSSEEIAGELQVAGNGKESDQGNL